MIYLLEYDTDGAVQNRKIEHERGRELLRFGLEKSYGLQAIVRQESGGKPYLENISGVYFNISHTSGLVACGIDEREIGIDVERICRYDRRLMQRICTEEEIAYICGDDREEEQAQNERFFRLWTLKESYLKATGQGLAMPMKEVSFVIDRGNPAMIRSNVSGWEFSQFRYARRYMISQCRAC
ncbi:MAG: 4'-phosphopantetheinyl transferase superfamily protein [Lachnospiraceae bacterium]|nr:4'-phosphopantetheinyl transferase superfamily protein [Lachnospiraceae bacterium]